jgi:hypothetical protein
VYSLQIRVRKKGVRDERKEKCYGRGYKINYSPLDFNSL